MRRLYSPLKFLSLVLIIFLSAVLNVAFAEDIEFDLGGSTPAPKATSQPSVAASKNESQAPSSSVVKSEAKASPKSKNSASGKSSVVTSVVVSPENEATKISIEGKNLPEPSIAKISSTKILLKFPKTKLKISSRISADSPLLKSVRSSVHPKEAWVVLDVIKAKVGEISKSERGFELSLVPESQSGVSKGEAPVSESSVETSTSGDNGASEEKKMFSRLIDISFKPLDKSLKFVLTADVPTKYTIRKLSKPEKLVLRFPNTRLEIPEKTKNFKENDEELQRGGLLSVELRQIGPSYSPISEAILTLLPGSQYQVDRDANQTVINLTAPVAAEKPTEKRGDINQLVSMEVQSADLGAVVNTLAGDANFDVDLVSGPVTGVVTDKFKDVPLKTALANLLTPYGYDYEVQGNTIRVGTQDVLKSTKLALPHVTEIVQPAGGMTPLQIDGMVKSVLSPTNSVVSYLDTVRNVIVLSGTAADVEDYKKTMRDLKLDEGSMGDRITRVVKLNYADPAQTLAILTPYLTPVGKVQVDTRNDGLVIWETASNMGVLLELVKELDIKTPQVLIESNIVEVDNENDLNLGVNWAATKSTGDPSVNVSSNLPPQNAALQNPPSFNFGTIRGGLDINATLTALETKKKGKVISRPRIATASGVPAEINTIENVVYQTETQNVSNGVITDIFTSNLLPLPIDLKVTPRITDDGNITTQMSVTIESVSGQAIGQNQPPTTTQYATTTITTKNGETIVIGGLVRNIEQETTNGIPILSSLPIIGGLFQSKDKSIQKEELVIFVTPTLLDD